MRTKRDIITGLNWIQDRGIAAIPDITYGFYKAYLWRAANLAMPNGTAVLDLDWDVLIILDACRLDLMEQVADDYPFINDIKGIRSLGANSREWMVKNFERAPSSVLKETAYVTANPLTEVALDAGRFGKVDEVWKYAWDDEVGTVPPRPVTDRAIKIHRDYEFDRLIIHYMQPHIPFINWSESETIDVDQVAAARVDKPNNTWEKVRRGILPKDEVMAAYAENLRLVLDDVDLLLDNMDASRVAISADHGNAVGEYGVYGHPKGNPLSCIREVPWCITSGEEHGTYSPDFTPGDMEGEVNDRLRALGYR